MRRRTIAAVVGAILGIVTFVACNPLVNVVQVVGGLSHTCTLHSDGTVNCWGQALFNQLGDGTGADSAGPVQVAGIDSATALAAGDHHTCAVLGDSTVRCWGNNANGQLGDGTTDSTAVPVVVSGLSDVVALGAGTSHTCAVLGSGGVRCWGGNGQGQLGDDSTSQSPAPVEVAGITDAVSVDAGGSTSCAVHDDGTVSCWGRGGSGQLGNGDTADSDVPVGVVGITDASAVSVGSGQVCALLDDTTVQCWGSNFLGQLGDGTTDDSSVPVDVLGISDAAELVVGNFHGCVRLADASARCWGDNTSGQLGDGTIDEPDGPVQVQLDDAAVASLGAGSFFTCAVLTDGTAACWGANDSGQIGDRTLVDQPAPVQVAKPFAAGTVVDVGVGDEHACALFFDGTVECWGNNDDGQLGDGSTDSRVSPFPVQLAGPAVALSVGDRHSCAILDDGTAQCWGNNETGQLGNGTQTDAEPVPVTVSNLAGVATISAGANHTCAITAMGSWCWGSNSSGQLGNDELGEDLVEPEPVAVQSLGLASDIAAGGNHSCAVGLDTIVKCWGSNSLGQLGIGGTGMPSPVPVESLAINAEQVDAGGSTTCALIGDGTAQCWGDNEGFLVGSGSLDETVVVPQSVFGVFDAVEIEVGLSSGCVRIDWGPVMCWGINDRGQIGDGTFFGGYPTPVQVAIIEGTTALSVGSGSACAVMADTTVRCWGGNGEGQLGDSTHADRAWANLPVVLAR